MAIRDIGRAVSEFARPDGGKLLDLGLSSVGIGEGLAERVTGLNPARSIDPIIRGSSTTASNPNKQLSISSNLPSVILNPLEQFASYSPMWTMACLTKKQFNNPPSYRNSPADLEFVIMSSGGRFDSQRVNTAHGTPEFFINNFTMKGLVAGGSSKTGNTNAFKFEWDIYEPYSMGTLLQSLQVAAKSAGYANYLDNAPYVLRLDFLGYDELGKQYKTVKPKFFVMKLINVKFQVNESGSTYKMEAIPYNHQGFSDAINVAYNDIKITAGTTGSVKSALSGESESLQKVLNDIEQRLLDDNQIGVKDEYIIDFPTSSSTFNAMKDIKSVDRTATVNPNDKEAMTVKGKSNVKVQTGFDTNDIGKASFGFGQSKGGNFVMPKHGDQVSKDGIVRRDNMTINPKDRTFQFAQGQSLTSIINQVILSSEYAKEAIDPNSKVGRTADGFIKWFRIDVQIELLEYDILTGDFAKRFTYRVVPFLVHESIFSNPTSVPNYAPIKKKITKAYNYIYTGQNVDVLKFDIEIKNSFFTGTQPGNPADAAKASDPNTGGGTSPQKNTEATAGKGSAVAAALATGGRKRNRRDPTAIDDKIKGGSRQQDVEQAVAASFHKAFTQNQTEMVTINIEILGDPYWIVDSGFANYFAPAVANNSQVTEDGTMNYEGSDVYIYLTFRTPSDINEAKGTYEFSYGGKESPFSGIYKVNQCESTFSEGMFRQKLSCMRMPSQAEEFKELPPEAGQTIKSQNGNDGAYAFGTVIPDRNSVADTATKARAGIAITEADRIQAAYTGRIG